MNKSKAIENSPEYYHKYIQLVDDAPLYEIFENGGIDLYLEHIEKLEDLDDFNYAEGKWTVKEIIQHLIDTERVFAYRAMRFARKDETNLPGFDENQYAANATVSKRKLAGLLEEYQLLRLANAYLFNQFTDEELARTGVANGNQISVGAIGYICIGHAIHHFNVIQERYLGAEK